MALSLAGGSLFQLNYVNAQLASTPWPMFHHDIQHTGRSPYNGPDNPQLKWSYTAGGVASYSSPAIASDGTIYFGSDDGKLNAINPNGTFKWSYNAVSSIRTSPAIGSDGTIYVSAGDNKLYAINPNGSFKWSYTAASSIYSSVAIAGDGTIYFGSGPHNLYAINPNGTFKWSYTAAGDSFDSSPAIASDGTVYCGSVDNKLYAINPDGSFKWSYTAGNYITSSPAIASDGTIYFGSNDHKLYAINPNGSFKWSYTAASSTYSSPAIASDGTIYFGSGPHNLYALNPNGSFKWSYTTAGDSFDSSPAIGSNGTIYCGSNDNKLYAINPDGTFKWSYTTGGSIRESSPAIGSDMTIYIGSDDNKLYAITQPAPTVTGVNPTSGNQGQTVNNVVITGTNFTGATVVSFGSGITTNSFTVDTGTQITARITIAAGATPGLRDVSVTTSGGTGTLPNGFTVLQSSVNTATGTGVAAFTTSVGTINNLVALTQSQLACRGAMPNLTFPYGFFSFNIVGFRQNGFTAIITITLPSAMPPTTQYWKCINGQWVNATSILGDNDGDNVLTLTLTDGGPFDADGVANSIIVDPGGPGVPPSQTFVQQPMRVSRPDPTVSLIIVKNLSVSPQQAYAGQPITISANMANDSDQIGGYTASLKIDGNLEKTKLGTVDAHSAVPVDFVVTRSQPGTYSYDLGGQKGTFTVLEAQASSGSPASGAVIAIIVLVALVISVAVVLMLTFRRTA